jgi:hypothetical protein
MRVVPLTVIDEFLPNPDAVVDFAMSQEYLPCPKGTFPGVRTNPLHEINLELFNYVCKRFFSVFYDYSNSSINWNSSIHFQKISNNLNKGWVHVDSGLISFVLYLNKTENLNSGTSLYRLKKEVVAPSNETKLKHSSYLGSIDPKEADVDLEKHNQQYEETIKVSSVYNRLIAFDSNSYHAAQDFYSNIEDRLTMVGFIYSLTGSSYPLTRVQLQ